MNSGLFSAHFYCSVWLSANSVKVLCDQWALSFDLHPCTRILRKPQVLEYELEFGSGTFNLDVTNAVLVLLGVGIEGDSWKSIYTSIVDSLAEKAVKQERTQVEHEPNIFGIPEIQGEKDSESEFPHASGPSDPGDMFHTAVMKRKDEQIRVLKLEIQQYRKTIRRLTQKNRRNNAKWIPVKHTQRKGFVQRRKPDQYHAGTGELRGRLSNHGAVTLALGTAASGTAAYRQGIAANTDVSGQTIGRWQSKVAACLTILTRDFYNENETKLWTHRGKGKQWSVHVPRMDGTNKKLVAKRSGQVFVCHSAYSLVDGEGVRHVQLATSTTSLALQFLRIPMRPNIRASFQVSKGSRRDL